MEASSTDTQERIIYTVTRLTEKIKYLLEDNFKIPASKHYYFTLKDEFAQINAIMFRGQNRNLKFRPEDGMTITGFGRINVYEPRGTYQIIFEYLEPKGVGELQVAFEQLKKKLAMEGLFDEKYKKALRFLPSKVSIVTSRSGAVIHDFMTAMNKRFPGIHIEVVPVSVQGDCAEGEIVSAIQLLNTIGNTDVIILARGGGSIEDLWAYNCESVARAVFASDIPVVSAIGHETDFTISDFVADLRAPTPTAAAEMVVPSKTEVMNTLRSHDRLLVRNFRQIIVDFYAQLDYLSERLVNPLTRIQDYRIRIDDYAERITNNMKKILRQCRERLRWRAERLAPLNIKDLRKDSDIMSAKLEQAIQSYLHHKNNRFKEIRLRLDAVGPMAVLSRGYSIARTVPQKNVVMDAADVLVGQELEIILKKGVLRCRVEDNRYADDDLTDQ